MIIVKKQNKRGVIINILTENDVTLEEVKLIDENGNQMGQISMKEAFLTAKDRKLDLAIVAESNGLKIAKIVNYGKILYEQKKAKKNQKAATKLKEIKFGMNCGEHDYQIKINKIVKMRVKPAFFCVKIYTFFR